MALRFYNTLTQKVEPFAPLHGNVVRMYTCGPTVYNYVHIGNLRTFTFQDILRRWLAARGFDLNGSGGSATIESSYEVTSSLRLRLKPSRKAAIG